MEAATASKPTPIRQKQFTLDAGGAIPDTAEIGSVTFAAGTKALADEIKKGSDVAVTLTARVVEVHTADKYDAHGHVSETIRRHDLRIDDIQVDDVVPQAFTLAAAAGSDDPEPEPGAED